MSIEEKFKEILASQAFEKLAPYREPRTWKSMTRNECELLGILFVKQGEHQLKNGDSRVLESFELASKVASQSPVVFFRQALAYAGQGNNIRCLTAACTALEKAIGLDPSFSHAWHSWGNALVRMGIVYDDIAYFYQADEKFRQAELLSAQQNMRLDTLLWHRAVCWFHIGKHSGEAGDFFQALEKFRLAESRGCSSGEFHNDFGNVLIDLAALLDRNELFSEAAEHYKKFTELVPTQYEGWLNLACTCQRLYDFSHREEDFLEAERCFERAAALNSKDATVWFRWAEIYAQSGKTLRNMERLQDSFDKFERADVLEPENPLVLLRWGEAEMIAGSQLENIELLRNAQNKIAFAVESMPEDPDVWYLYGVCFTELGHYFETSQYYYQAIEKFKYGLSFEEDHCLLMHAIALAYFNIADLEDDQQMLEQALYLFEKIEMDEHSLSSFLSDWGVALMKMGELTHQKHYVERAAEKFELAINDRLDKGQVETLELEWLYNYGCAMDFLGDFHEEGIYYEKAIQIFSHVRQLDPGHTSAKYRLALAFFHLGELNSDIENFHKAIELFHEIVLKEPEDELFLHDYGMALLHLALLTDASHIEDSKKLFEQAESRLLQAIALGSLQGFYTVACLYAITQNATAAMHYLERAEQSKTLPRYEDLLEDEWLDNLEDHPAFLAFLDKLRDK